MHALCLQYHNHITTLTSLVKSINLLSWKLLWYYNTAVTALITCHTVRPQDCLVQDINNGKSWDQSQSFHYLCLGLDIFLVPHTYNENRDSSRTSIMD